MTLIVRDRSLLPIMVVINGLDLDDEYIVRVASYNGSGPTGGDSLTEDLNIWYEVSHSIPQTCEQEMQSCADKLVCKDWRLRMDDHSDCACPAHDSGCRVSSHTP